MSRGLSGSLALRADETWDAPATRCDGWDRGTPRPGEKHRHPP